MRTRFAASSAALRIGRARLAVVAWLAARHAGGTFALRLHGETPPELDWLGLNADTTERFADRADRHDSAVQRLRVLGRLYPCLETEDELRWKREQRIRRNQAPVYDRAMLTLTAAQLAAAEAGGKRPYWRFRLSEAPVAWRDRAAGPIEVKLTAHSDPVAVAADGTLSALFAAAVDDASTGIDLLVRDLTQSAASAIQLDMMAAIGAAPAAMAMAHLPPLPEAFAVVPVRRLRQDGVEAAALVTLLATPAAEAPASLAQLAAAFDLGGCGRAVRSVGMERLRAMNRLALADLPFAAVADRLPDGADAAFWHAVRGGIDLLSEARHWWDVTGDGFVPPVVDDADLASARDRMPPEPWDATTWARWTDGLDATTLRLALTDEESGPEMAALLPLIGRARARRRLGGGAI